MDNTQRQSIFESFFNTVNGHLPEGVRLEMGHSSYSFFAKDNAGEVVMSFWINFPWRYGRSPRFYASGPRLPEKGKRNERTMYRESFVNLIDEVSKYMRSFDRVELLRLAKERATSKSGLSERPYRGEKVEWSAGTPYGSNAIAMVMEAYCRGFRFEDERFNAQCENKLREVAKDLSDDLWYWVNVWGYNVEINAAEAA